MLSPPIGRIVFRILGSALLGWGALRCYVAFEILRNIGDGGGELDGMLRVLAYILGSWGAYDTLAALLLLALRNWAKYVAFVTFALHGALGFWLSSQATDARLAIGVVVASVVGATLLVLCGDINRAEQLR